MKATGSICLAALLSWGPAASGMADGSEEEATTGKGGSMDPELAVKVRVFFPHPRNLFSLPNDSSVAAPGMAGLAASSMRVNLMVWQWHVAAHELLHWFV